MEGVSRYGTHIKTVSEVRTIESGNLSNNENEDILLEQYMSSACDDSSSNQAEINIPRQNEKISQKNSKIEKSTLLEKQVKNQIKFHEASITLLENIDRNQQKTLKILSELNQNLSNMNKYLKRSCDFKDREYKLQKEKFEFKKRHIQK